MITFRQFDKADWEAFSGCESEQPTIAKFEPFVMLVDGENVSVMEVNEETEEMCETHVTLRSPVEAESTAQTLANAYEVMGERAFRVLWTAIHRSDPAFVS
jgi:hypothetical protein